MSHLRRIKNPKYWHEHCFVILYKDVLHQYVARGDVRLLSDQLDSVRGARHFFELKCNPLHFGLIDNCSRQREPNRSL